jgi:NADP-dependent 3-hydroxy acid dehydrogenase YdfG
MISMTDMGDDPRIAFVTGASHGIGRSIAIKFSQVGMRVVAAARTTSQLKEIVGQFGVIPISFDVSDADPLANSVAQVESNWGPIDLLVNNAGTRKC